MSSSKGDVYRHQAEHIRDLQSEIRCLQAELASRPVGNYRYDHCFGEDGGIRTLYVPDTAKWFVEKTKWHSGIVGCSLQIKA